MTLSPAKQALLSRRLKGATDAARKPALSIPPRADADWAPLSSAQRQMWVINQMTPGKKNPAYNLPNAYRVRGALDIDALEAAFNGVIRRHEVLRTTFEVRDGEPVQCIHPSLSIAIDVTALEHLPEGERERAMHDLASKEAVRPFDLSALPLIRVRVFKLDDTDHVLLINLHHIVGDGVSVGLLLNELGAFYRALAEGGEPQVPALAVQYGDYAQWQRQTLADESRYADQITWWQKRLAGLPVLELPTDHARPTAQSFEGSNVFFRIPSALAQSLKALGVREQCTPYMTLMAAYQVLLHRYAGAEDIVIGTPVTTRGARDLEPLVGNFLNLVPLRCDVSGDPTFSALLRRTRDAALDAFSNSDLPYEALLKHIKFERDPSRNPVFQVMLQVMSAESPRLADLRVEPFHFDLKFAQFDLSLHLYEEADGIVGRFEYCTALFAPETVERMSRSFLESLGAITADPQQRVSMLPILTAADRRLVVEEWNGPHVEYPDGLRVTDLIEARVARTPDRMAVTAGETTLTYAALDTRAAHIAQALRARGAQRGQRVGLCLDRNADMLAALLGVLKAGATFVPLDPSFPEARLRFMAEDAGLALVVSTAELAGIAGLPRDGQLRLDEDAVGPGEAADAAGRPSTADGGDVHGADAAYVLYTSGSTGKPKGVMVPHRALVNFLMSMAREPGLSADDKIVAITTLSFDISLLELLLPLTVGAHVVIASRDEATDGEALRQLMERHRASVMQATPATWRMLIDAGWRARTPFRALVGGEALPANLAEQLLSFGAEVWNMYGPTETTVWSTCGRVDNTERVTIGRPIANTSVLVLDAHGQLAPIGVPGEAWIAGDGVALGYHNRPDLTSERFARNPVDGAYGERAYRTGDLVRWLADGRLEHLGRLDRQLKIRGFRIEPGEIERVLARHAAVATAVVDARSAAGGEARLVAYLVLKPGARLTASEARRYLRAHVPEYMVPGIVVPIASVPMTPNGKVDRAALPDPFDSVRSIVEFERPCTPAEEMVAEVWRDLLHVENVGRHSQFFELGGHSLLALRAVHALEERTGVRVDPRRFFFQTLARIATAFAQSPAAAG